MHSYTGELLCRQVPEYASGYVEEIPPCVWSDNEADGLPQPPLLTPDTRLVRTCWVVDSCGRLGLVRVDRSDSLQIDLMPGRSNPTQMSVARYDSSHGGHLGVMASWQCRGRYVATEPTPPQPPHHQNDQPHPPPRGRV
jgi:hypothetical protein